MPITRDEVSGRWASLVVRNASRRACYVPIARSLEMLPDVTNEPESYGVLESDTELENKVDRAGSAGQGRVTPRVTRAKAVLSDHATLCVTLMILNQLRQKIGVTFGSPETTTGGNALKFYASMRFDVRRIGQVKVGDEPVGGRTRVKVAKNKC